MAAAVGVNKQTNAASMEPCVRHGRGTTGNTVKVRTLNEQFEPISENFRISFCALDFASVASVRLGNVVMFCINRIYFLPVFQFSPPASGLVKIAVCERLANHGA